MSGFLSHFTRDLGLFISEALGLRKNILRIKFTHREKAEVHLGDWKVLSVAGYNVSTFIVKNSKGLYERNRTKGDTFYNPHPFLSKKGFHFKFLI